MPTKRTTNAKEGEDVTSLVETYEHAGLTVEIHYDQDCESPRTSQCNLAKMVLAHRRYNLPHEVEVPDSIESGQELHDFLVETYEPLVILPVWGYDHGSLHLKAGGRAGVYADRWDSGMAGFVMVCQAEVDELGAPLDSLEEQAKNEVEEYDRWANGDVYGYTVSGQDGRQLEACWGFIGDDYAKQEANRAADGEAEHLNQALEDSRDWREAVTLARALLK